MRQTVVVNAWIESMKSVNTSALVSHSAVTSSILMNPVGLHVSCALKPNEYLDNCAKINRVMM